MGQTPGTALGGVQILWRFGLSIIHRELDHQWTLEQYIHGENAENSFDEEANYDGTSLAYLSLLINIFLFSTWMCLFVRQFFVRKDKQKGLTYYIYLKGFPEFMASFVVPVFERSNLQMSNFHLTVRLLRATFPFPGNALPFLETLSVGFALSAKGKP